MPNDWQADLAAFLQQIDSSQDVVGGRTDPRPPAAHRVDRFVADTVVPALHDVAVALHAGRRYVHIGSHFAADDAGAICTVRHGKELEFQCVITVAYETQTPFVSCHVGPDRWTNPDWGATMDSLTRDDIRQRLLHAYKSAVGRPEAL